LPFEVRSGSDRPLCRFTAGYFPADLMVKRDCDLRFVSLNEVDFQHHLDLLKWENRICDWSFSRFAGIGDVWEEPVHPGPRAAAADQP
jgi:hypothetical protein